ISSDGVIVTNNHVVEGSTSVTVAFLDRVHRKPLRGTVIGTAPERDLAVIRVDATDLVPIAVARSSALRLGDGLIAIGFPLGLGGPTVTRGIVSGLNRTIEPQGGARLEGLLQTDAAINPGNSGGALVDREGRVIGISTAIASLGGLLGGGGGSISIGFAIPIDEARAVAEEIIRTGRATHPFLGISGNDITPQTAEQFGTKEGALVMEVTRGGPAERAGLRARDIIVRLGDDEITSMGDLIGAIRSHRIGETVEVAYVRDGRQSSVRVTLQQKPSG
ncbi:MAG TPA: trypsin-like peptidase domain-containing protein, partial [Frankiaceae bacterium]|nr:trypsin-like peptidase domain-containing protein [Frankiaceae bacterium]